MYTGGLPYYGSHVQIFFKSAVFFPFVLQQQLTTLDFVSYCGGALGLFLGFSVLSGVEILFYISFRCMNQKSRDNKVQDSSSLSDQNSKKILKKIINVFEKLSIHGFVNFANAKNSKFER